VATSCPGSGMPGQLAVVTAGVSITWRVRPERLRIAPAATL
jgi:hypothetical protein